MSNEFRCGLRLGHRKRSPRPVVRKQPASFKTTRSGLATQAGPRILGNMADLTAPLTEDEFLSLRELEKGATHYFPDSHGTKLISLGYVAERLGALSLTDAGRARPATRKD